MTTLNEKLSKSLEEIETLADEVLAKSEETEVVETAKETEDVEKGLNPADVSEDSDVADTTKAKDDEDEDEDKDKEDKTEDVKKSFAELLEENEELSKGIEVSEFLNEFARLHGTITDSLRDDVAKSLETSTHTATILAKSFNAIMKSQGNLSKSIEDLTSRLNDVERQPVQRKALVNVVEKSFNHSVGIDEPVQELSKSQKLDKLTNLAMSGAEGVTINDVVSYESTGKLRPELETLFQK